jgi:two-component system, NarL family, response regulator NreC
MKIKVLIADDHMIIREGLRSLIEKEAGMEVVAEAGSGREAIRLVEKLKPGVVIMDIAMSDMNGVEASRKITTGTPEVKVLALSMHRDRRYVLGMLEAGASGYVLKDCAFEELAGAIRQVAMGHTYLSPRIADVVVKGYLNKLSDASHAGGVALTPREREILQLIAEGLTTREIGARVYLSTKTVETHRRNILQKLKLRNAVDLTKYALREGLVSLDG